MAGRKYETLPWPVPHPLAESEQGAGAEQDAVEGSFRIEQRPIIPSAFVRTSKFNPLRILASAAGRPPKQDSGHYGTLLNVCLHFSI